MADQLLTLAELLQPATGGPPKLGLTLLEALLHSARPASDNDRFTAGLSIVPRAASTLDPFPVLF